LQSTIHNHQEHTLKAQLRQVEQEYENEYQNHEKVSRKKEQMWQDLSTCEKSIVTLEEKTHFLKKSLEQETKEEQKNISRLQETKELIQKHTEQVQNIQQEKIKQQKLLQDKEDQISTLKADYERAREQTNQIQNEIMDLHQQQIESEEAISHLKIQSESFILKKSAITEKLSEKYQIDSLDLSSVGFSHFHREAEETELNKMNHRLSNMGAVNLLALEEYEELAKENLFYQKQHEDLQISKEKLSQVISRIDRFCSKKFKEVFDQVNSCFSKVWPSLFEGGKAELILVNEKDIQGMDIIVHPPGKKVQNMNLLSGGEKAMTAIAVIFSIFLVKPSPFCILDEVDAPLDDRNIIRFNSLLSEMAHISQVIIITHNKHTMKNCNYLYGVTMEERGISKLMSLNMNSLREAEISI